MVVVSGRVVVVVDEVVVLYQADVVLVHGDDVVEAEQDASGGVKLPDTHVSQSACSPHSLNRKQISVCHEKYAQEAWSLHSCWHCSAE